MTTRDRRLLGAAVAAVPVLAVALLMLPPPVLVALLVADVAVIGWAVARWPARRPPPRLSRRTPPPRRYWDPDTGQIYTGDPPAPLRPGVTRAVTTRQAEVEQRIDVDHDLVRTDRTIHVRTGLGDALRAALGVDDESTNG